MSKLAKLIKHPILFLKDGISKSKKKSIKKQIQKKIPVNFNFIEPEYKINSGKNYFMFLPWIKTHGDKLINQINKSDKYEIIPIRILENFNEEKRVFLSRFSRKHPDLYRRILLKHLISIKNNIDGVIVTFDWHPVMRILVNVVKS